MSGSHGVVNAESCATQAQTDIVAQLPLVDEAHVPAVGHGLEVGQVHQGAGLVAQQDGGDVEDQFVDQAGGHQGAAEGGTGFDVDFVAVQAGQVVEDGRQVEFAVVFGDRLVGDALNVRIAGTGVRAMQQQCRCAAIQQVAVFGCAQVAVEDDAQWWGVRDIQAHGQARVVGQCGA